MKSEHLHYLTEIDKCNSISVAAQKLYLSQASLSTILKNVEDEIGFEVFRRVHTGVRITPEGEEALVLVSEIEEAIEQIYQIGKHIRTYSQPVSIITSPTICSGLALPLYEAFLARDPAGTLSFSSISGEEVGTKLIKNEGHIGLTYFSKERLNNYQIIAEKYQIEVEPLYKDQFYLLVSQDHPLASYDRISCQALEDLHFASLPCYGDAGSSLLSHPQIFSSSNRYTTFSEISFIKKAVLNQNMAAVLSGYSIWYNQTCSNDKLKALQLTGFPVENKMSLCLIRRCNQDLRYQEKLAVQCIKEYFQGLPQPPFAPKATR